VGTTLIPYMVSLIFSWEYNLNCKAKPKPYPDAGPYDVRDRAISKGLVPNGK